MQDLYETGTPKYGTAQSIYEALCELVQTEEMGILSEMFEDVSYDNQTYYYTDKGNTLKDKFEELSDYGNSMWLMDLAIWQIDGSEIHDIIYDALNNPDLAKRIGFKKLFVDEMLYGDKSNYNEITTEYFEELSELDYFDFMGMVTAFNRVMNARNAPIYKTPYSNFCHLICGKVEGLRLQEETCLIVECRALLTSYDDFMFGLRSNQYLYNRQEQAYSQKIAKLEADYEKKVNYLLSVAERVGLLTELTVELQQLDSDSDRLLIATRLSEEE